MNGFSFFLIITSRVLTVGTSCIRYEPPTSNEDWSRLFTFNPRRPIHVSLTTLEQFTVSYFPPRGRSVTVSEGCLTGSAWPKPGAYLVVLPRRPADSGGSLSRALSEQVRKLRCSASAWNPAAEFLVLAKTHDAGRRALEQTVKDILTVMWANSVYRVIVIVELERRTELMTADPFDDWSECGKFVRTTRRLVKGPGPATNMSNMFFPLLNMTEFPGCSVRVSWRESLPFSFLEERERVLDSEPRGLDARLVRLAASRSRWRIAWEERRSSEKDNTVSLESLHLFYEELARAKMDIAIGGVEVLHEQQEQVWYTDLTGVQSVMFFVAEPQLLPQWKTLYAMFMPRLWTAVIITFFVSVLLLYLYCRWSSYPGSDLSGCFLTVFAIITERPVIYPDSAPIRGATGALILYSYALSICYSSLLASFMASRPRDHQIHNLEELVEANVSVMLTRFTENLIANDISEGARRALRYREMSAPIESAVARLETRRDRALLEKDFPVQYLVHKKGYSVYKVHPPVHTIHNALVTTKGSLYFQRLQFFVTAYAENGFKDKWKSDLLGRPLSAPLKVKGRSPPKVLTIKNLQVMFSVLLAGYAISSIALILEFVSVAYDKYKKKRLKDKLAAEIYTGLKLKARKLLILRLD